MKKRILRNIEWGILVCTILLIIIGVIALFSSTQNSNYDELKNLRLGNTNEIIPTLEEVLNLISLGFFDLLGFCSLKNIFGRVK